MMKHQLRILETLEIVGKTTLRSPVRMSYCIGALAVVCVIAGENLELVCPGFQVQFHSNH